MAVKREEIEAKGKELGIELSEEQISAHLTLGILPTKEAGAGDDEEDEDEDDDDNLTAGMKKRVSKLAGQRNKAREERDEARRKLKEITDGQTKREAEKKKEAGKTEELLTDANTKLEKAQTALTAAREKVKTNAIRNAVTTGLIAAGILDGVDESKRSARMKKALKLFDLEDVEFEWKDEDSFEYELDDVSDLVKGFKEDNDFLFTGESGNNEPQFPEDKFRNRTPGKKPKKSEKPDEVRERLREAGFSEL